MVSGKISNKEAVKKELLLILPKIDSILKSEPTVLRGNHETVDMNLYYGFFEEIGSDQAFLLRISRTYDMMPIATVLLGHTFCVHGGVNGTGSIDAISKEKSFSYLWNDPSNRPRLTNSTRGSTVKEFGPDVVDRFFKD
jgi:hypothetical protein